jgi:hypothetical protein
MSTNVTSVSPTPDGTSIPESGATLPALPTFRIIEFKYDALSSSNYVRWARRMRDHLVLCGFDKVLLQSFPADSQYNLLARSVIRSNVDDDQLTAIEGIDCAHQTSWAVGTGGTHHMTSIASCLTELQQSDIKSIVFGGGDAVRVVGQAEGDCSVKPLVQGKCHVLTLKNVLLLGKLS